MDGSSRMVLHNTDLVWPNAITVDYESQILYWADANLDKIESSHVDGSNRVIITTNFIVHPFAITFFNQQLYWSDWAYDAVLTLNLSEPDSIELLAGSFTSEPMGVHIVAKTRQPEGEYYMYDTVIWRSALASSSYRTENWKCNFPMLGIKLHTFSISTVVEPSGRVNNCVVHLYGDSGGSRLYFVQYRVASLYVLKFMSVILYFYSFESLFC